MLVDQPPTSEPEENAPDILAALPAVSIRDLRIDYGSHEAIKGMDLDIPQGVIYGLVGPNGAGKTSTFKAITSLLQPTNGSICVNGHDVVTHRRKAQASIGYMPDMAPVSSDLKLWEFLDLFAASHGLSSVEKKERVAEVLKQVELADRAELFCSSLSRGMMQRLVLAKTLIHHPKVLILDEPASGMDVRSRVALRNILRNVCAAGSTVLVSSHILPELSEMCDMIGVLHKGELLETGTVNGVLSRMTSLLPEIHVTLATPTDSHWKEWLLKQDKVSVVHFDDVQHVSFHFDGDDLALSTMLEQALAAGYPICRVHERQRSLEDILMELEYEDQYPVIV